MSRCQIVGKLIAKRIGGRNSRFYIACSDPNALSEHSSLGLARYSIDLQRQTRGSQESINSQAQEERSQEP
jgi:hypothetical protein